ncbi:MAG: peroxiredoxin [Rhodothalassiaceae bacterium]
MLTVGDRLPSFNLKAVSNAELPDGDFPRLTDQSHPGKWKLIFFWPKDFTFICPTEIIAFGALAKEFADRNCVVLGASTDTDFVHFAWRKSRDDLAAVPYPWLADNKKELAGALGILEKSEGVALRATFLVDPEGIIRYAQANDLSVGRNPEEVLRILDALQTEELCPCNWKQGDATIDLKKEVA